jgi:capsular exopolysaccharide synthesis family protein
MSDPSAPVRIVPAAPPPLPAAVRTNSDGVSPVVPRPPYERPWAAIRRYKWIVVGTVATALVLGLIATRAVKPEYEVRATIYIEPEVPVGDASGPIRSRELLNSSAWLELLRSYRIVDAVVQKLSLYLHPENKADQDLFASFGVDSSFTPGKYELTLDRERKRWRLQLANAAVADSGTMNEPIGHRIGFLWTIPSTAYEGNGTHKATFTVATPRETAVDLMSHLSAELPPASNFMWLRFRDRDPQRARLILNTWVKEYVDVASELKRRNVVEFARILNGQLQYAETSLRSAERSLENFRVHTITLPSEGGPVAPGVEMTRDPAMKSFFDQKIAYDDVRHDREALQKVIAGARAGTTPWEAALLIPSVASSTGAAALRNAFDQLHAKQADLAAKRQIYTDQHPTVQDVAASVRTLETQTIPTLASQVLAQLQEREGQYSQRISSASREMQSIPTRTIEEMRLRRAVSVAEGLYTTLKSRSAEVQLAAASATPDVAVLDSAVAPLRPSRNTAPSILLLALVGGLGAAVTLALLLDAFDPKIRHPEQVTHELGLSIAGAIPRFPKGTPDNGSPEQLSQIIESIRSVRMHIQNTAGTPVSVAVSSPSPGDGKSLVCADLALSFSDAGYRTVLVDGDTRRGTLHELFEESVQPGLTDFLSGEESLDAVVRQTSHDRFFIVPRGRKVRRSPELLTSPRLALLAAELRQQFDVVVFDTPPLAAGIDAFAVAAAAQNLLLVLRVGKTERRMASAKLQLVDRMSVRVLGAVLNGVDFKGEYEYYGYAEGYRVDDDEPDKRIAGPGRLSAKT